jgi:hypothetical protein
MIGRRSFAIGNARKSPTIARNVIFTPRIDFEEVAAMIRIGNK